jgi:formate dehydrogenase subunit gamma
MTLHVVSSSLATRVDAICDSNQHLEGPLLPILHDVQEEFGYVPEEALRQIAGRLNISRAEIHGVATFYHDFRHKPAGRHIVKMCRAEACQAVGSEALAKHAEHQLDVKFGETTKDGSITLEAVYCLGLCACGPAALVDGVVVGRLNDAKLDAIIEGCRT